MNHSLWFWFCVYMCVCVHVCIYVVNTKTEEWLKYYSSLISLSLQVLHWVINNSSLLPFTLLFYVFYICVFIYVLAVTPVAFVITLGFFRPPEKASENRLSLSALLLPSFNLLLFLPGAGIFPSLSVLELAVNTFSDLSCLIVFHRLPFQESCPIPRREEYCTERPRRMDRRDRADRLCWVSPPGRWGLDHALLV